MSINDSFKKVDHSINKSNASDRRRISILNNEIESAYEFVKFFDEDQKLTKPIAVPVMALNKYLKSRNLDEHPVLKKQKSQRSNREIIMSNLEQTCNKMMDDCKNLDIDQSYVDALIKDPEGQDVEQQNKQGYIQTKENENVSLQWLDSFEKQGIQIDEIIQQYQNDVLLQKVFGLSEFQQDILKTKNTHRRHRVDKFTVAAKGRQRNLKTVFFENKYLLVIDDSSQRKDVQNQLSVSSLNFVSSLIVIEFNPNTYEINQLSNETLFKCHQPIFMNSQVFQDSIYYIQIDSKNFNEFLNDSGLFKFKLMKKHLKMDESSLVQEFTMNVKHSSVTSIIMSKVFKEGNTQSSQIPVLASNKDMVFLQNLYLGVSTVSESQDHYETQIFKFQQDTKGQFKNQQNSIELTQMIQLPNFLMLNTSSFEVFLKGDSHQNQTDSYEWEIKENFLALNGWNHLTRDRRTIYKLIEILNTEEVDDKLDIEDGNMPLLNEVSPMKIDFQDFMATQGCITNTLVRYFEEMSTNLSQFNVLYQQIPQLNTFDMMISPISIEPQIVQDQTWPQGLKSVCDILYEKYMESLSNLKESRKFSIAEESEQSSITQAIFDNTQSKFFLMINYFSEGQDELIFIELIQPQNHLDIIKPDQSVFNSALDKHLCTLFCNDQQTAYRGNSKLTVSKKLKNVSRSHTHVNMNHEEILNTIDDKPNKFNVLQSKVMNIFKQRKDLLNKDIQQQLLKLSKSAVDEDVSNSVGFCEDSSFFHRFKDKKCFNILVSDQSHDQMLQLEFKEYNNMEQLPEKPEVTLLVSKVRFVEDDRWQVPFIAIAKRQHSKNASSVWFVILNLQSFKVERTVNLNLTNSEQKELMRSMSLGYQNFDQIVLCQSQSCLRVDDSNYSSNFVKSPKKCYMDKYQVAIFLKETKRIKIFEMTLFWNQQQSAWSDLGGSMRAKNEFNIICFQSGQKEIYAKSDRHFDCVQLIPVFDEFNRIIYNQILLKQEDEFGRIILTDSFKDFNFHTQNDIFKFGYKIFRAKQSQHLDFLQIDANFSSKVLKLDDKSLFRDFVFSQLLNTQIKTVANMIPFDFLSWVTRDTSKCPRHFRPLELLQGHSQIEFIFKDPHKLQKIFQTKDEIYSDYKFMTLMERITHDDPERQKTLRQIGIMSQRKELSYNFYQGNCLERCFLGGDSVELMSSADLIIKLMLNFKMSETRSMSGMLVSILPYVTIENENRLNFSKQYINFFIDTPDKTILSVFQDQNDEYDEIHQRFETRLHDEDHNLQSYLDDKLTVEHLTLTSNQFGEIDLSSRVKSHIQSKPKPSQSIYEVEHSYVDLRQINLSLIRRTLNDDHQKHRNCTEYLLSDCVHTLVKNYFHKIGHCSIIQKLITDVYQRRTRNYYLFLFVVYICGFVIPFVNLIFKALPSYKPDESGILQNFELYICLLTQGLLLYIELIQFIKYREDYLQSIWNFVDILNFILYLVFFALRTNHFPTVESDGDRFLPISYMSDEEHSKEDRGSVISGLEADRLFTLAIMQSVSIILIASIILKIFSFLKVEPSIGAFIETFYQILHASQQFLIFFTYWILTFALCYMVVGIKLEDLTQPNGNYYDSHTTFQIIIGYIILSVKNAIAGPEDPTDNFWTNLDQDMEDLYPNLTTFMGVSVILLWVCGIYLLLVILLNMLISIVSEAYAEFSNNKQLYTFRQQAEMNRECNLILSSFPANLVFKTLGMENDLDCIVLSTAVPQEPAKEDNILELSQGVRNMILNQNQLIQIQSQQMLLQSQQFSILQDQLREMDQKMNSSSPLSPKLNIFPPDEAKEARQRTQTVSFEEMEEFQFKLVSNQRRASIKRGGRIIHLEEQIKEKQNKKMREMQKIMKVKQKRNQGKRAGREVEPQETNFDEDDEEQSLDMMFKQR